MRWEAFAVEIVFADDGELGQWLDTAIDPWDENGLQDWDWHGLFHEELADGQGEGIPVDKSPRELREWVSLRLNADDGASLVEPATGAGSLSYAAALGAEPTVDVPIVTCALVLMASKAGATCRLLMLGGHDPHNMFGYPDDFRHVLIRQPEGLEAGVAADVFEPLMGLVSTGKLDEAFRMANDNPADDDL